MSRRHNVRKERSPSQYPARLAARGVSSASVRMPFIDRFGRDHHTIESAVRAERPRANEDGAAR